MRRSIVALIVIGWSAALNGAPPRQPPHAALRDFMAAKCQGAKVLTSSRVVGEISGLLLSREERQEMSCFVPARKGRTSKTVINRAHVLTTGSWLSQGEEVLLAVQRDHNWKDGGMDCGYALVLMRLEGKKWVEAHAYPEKHCMPEVAARRPKPKGSAVLLLMGHGSVPGVRWLSLYGFDPSMKIDGVSDLKLRFEDGHDGCGGDMPGDCDCTACGRDDVAFVSLDNQDVNDDGVPEVVFKFKVTLKRGDPNKDGLCCGFPEGKEEHREVVLSFDGQRFKPPGAP